MIFLFYKKGQLYLFDMNKDFIDPNDQLYLAINSKKFLDWLNKNM